MKSSHHMKRTNSYAMALVESLILPTVAAAARAATNILSAPVRPQLSSVCHLHLCDACDRMQPVQPRLHIV